ncbi:Flagellin protein FlaA [Chitinispirillum alkaliphilum]|nr:Flagellin protein FlaA [Chitinispirillum alkaliphilum]
MSFNVGSLNRATTVMSRSFTTAGNDMSRALERISSGSRINRASDDFSGFASVVNLSNEAKSFQNRAVQLREQGAIVEQSLDVANQVLSDLYSMQTALADGDTQQAAAIGVAIEEALKLQAHDNTNLLSNTLATDLGIRGATGDALGVSISAITGLAAIDGDSDAAAVTAAIGEAQVFVKELQGLQSAVQSHTALAEVMASNSEAVSSAITSIDEAAEMAKYVEADIRQQAAVSMFSQANMSRRNISMLYR